MCDVDIRKELGFKDFDFCDVQIPVVFAAMIFAIWWLPLLTVNLCRSDGHGHTVATHPCLLRFDYYDYERMKDRQFVKSMWAD